MLSKVSSECERCFLNKCVHFGLSCGCKSDTLLNFIYYLLGSANSRWISSPNQFCLLSYSMFLISKSISKAAFWKYILMPTITLHKSKCVSTECLSQSIIVYKAISTEIPWTELSAACLWSGVNYHTSFTTSSLAAYFQVEFPLVVTYKTIHHMGPTYVTRFHLATAFFAFLPIAWFIPPAYYSLNFSRCPNFMEHFAHWKVEDSCLIEFQKARWKGVGS